MSRYTFAFALAGLLVAGLAASSSPAARRGGDAEILILPGNPDLAVVDGDTLADADAKAAFRWTGVELQWTDALVQGRCIRLVAAVDPGRYEVRADLAMIEDRPCTVEMSLVAATAPLDGMSIAMLPLKPGDRHSLSANITIVDGPLDLFLKPDVGCRIAVTGIHIAPLDGKDRPRLGSLAAAEIAGMDRANRIPLGRTAAAAVQPNELLRAPVTAPTETRACLREVCDYLVRYQLSTGLFDLESAAWWKASICVRALLAGYELFREPRYLAAARKTLDAFIAEQDEDGGWCAFSRAQQPDVPCDRRNLADLGSMTSCLSIAGWFMNDEALSKRYTDAHERYLRGFAASHQAKDGSFRNGVYEGRNWGWPYSVATATQATSLISLYRAIPDTTILGRAERAAWFLLLDWDTDGQPSFHSHDLKEAVRLRATEVHDLYYMLEGLLWVARSTKDPVLSDAARMTLRNYILGRKGLLKELDGSWFSPSGDPATVTKSCGMLAILIEARDMIGPDEQLDRTIDTATSLLCAPSTREDYRVLAPPYEKAGDPAIICTAFAGLSFAEAMRHGCVFGSTPR